MDTPVISAYELEHYYKRGQSKVSNVSHLTVPLFQVNPGAHVNNATPAEAIAESSESGSDAESKIP